jgi:hypothetical protein
MSIFNATNTIYFIYLLNLKIVRFVSSFFKFYEIYIKLKNSFGF